jgi:hypothetical protein
MRCPHLAEAFGQGVRLKREIALAWRQWDEPEAALQQAPTVAQDIGKPTQLWRTLLSLGQLYTDARKLEMARQPYHAARELIARIRESLRDPGLRVSLENSPLIRHVYDLTVPS